MKLKAVSPVQVDIEQSAETTIVEGRNQDGASLDTARSSSTSTMTSGNNNMISQDAALTDNTEQTRTRSISASTETSGNNNTIVRRSQDISSSDDAVTARSTETSGSNNSIERSQSTALSVTKKSEHTAIELSENEINLSKVTTID